MGGKVPSENAIASNCRMLRNARGLSQIEMAEKVGLSRAGYLKIESGESTPRSDTLERLASALGVKIAELMRAPDQLQHVRFRSKKRINSREELLVEVKSRLDAYQALAQALGDQRRPAAVEFPRKDIEKAAQAVRLALKRTPDEPIHDICGLVESAGYRLLKVRLSSTFLEGEDATDRAEGFFGLSVFSEDDVPAIVVNDFERISIERRIFTVAHELGHVHLHRDSYTAAETDEREKEELEADLFASHFLMPRARFDKEWEGAYGLPFIERVLKVKRIFRVSYKTVLRRLQDQGDENLYPRFFGMFKKRFGRSLTKREEPSPLDESDFEADLLPSMVRQGVEREILSQARAAELLGVELKQFRERASEWNLTG